MTPPWWVAITPLGSAFKLIVLQQSNFTCEVSLRKCENTDEIETVKQDYEDDSGGHLIGVALNRKTAIFLARGSPRPNNAGWAGRLL